MNALVVLSALVSAAIAVPSYDYSPVITKSYAEPIHTYSAPVAYSRSYEAPVLAKSYAEPMSYGRSYEAPILTKSYAAPVLTKAYSTPIAYGNYGGYGGYENAGYGKGYSTGFSTHYSIRHDVPSKSYAQPIYAKSYAQPIYAKAAYAAPAVSYGAPLAYAKSYEAPVLTKSYAAPIAEPIALNYGKMY